MGVFEQLADLDKTPPLTPPEPAKPAEPGTTEITSTPPPVKPTKGHRRVNPQPPSPPVIREPRSTRQRIITRNSFEIYQDQIEVLRQVSLTAKLAGDKLSISEMVREALDSYLTAKNLKL